MACKRHLDDMGRKGFEYTFDAAEAERHIALANMLTIGEGAGPERLRLRGFQEFIVGSLFGWRRKRSRVRRYREAYVQLARQNGKSFLAAAICNDFATFSGYRHGRVICAATKQDQANIVWDEIRKFIVSDPDLMELYRVREHDRTIHSLVTGTDIKAIGRDTKSADGFRSILAIIDEYHAHPTRQMYKLANDGQIKVDNALTLAITTAGLDLNSPCYEHYRFCRRVLAGAVRKDSLFVYIAEMDDDDDPWEMRNWAKANPLNLWEPGGGLDDLMLARMAEKAIEAREKQGAELVNFQTKSLGRWVTYSGGAFVDALKWARCGTDGTIRDMAGRECYLGIDLSSGGDLTSIALVFPPEEYGGAAYVWSHSYMPELRLAEHEKTDDAPYRIWAEAGLLTLTSGMYGVKTDYRHIAKELEELVAAHGLRVVGCGYDRHNIEGLLPDLERILGCDLVDVPQSARSLSGATEDFRLSVEAGTVAYDRGNALLTWSMVNASMGRPNSFGESKIEKEARGRRIDPCDAVIDAWKVYLADGKGVVDGNRNLEIYLEEMGLGGGDAD